MNRHMQQRRTDDGRGSDLERRVRALENRMAVELGIDPIPGLQARDVQAALALIAAKIDLSGLEDAADDAAAALAGVEVNELYRDGSNLKVRVA